MNEKNKDLTKNKLIGKDLLKYIGPGILVTVGFIDPGNWVSNIAAGSNYGYKLLWIVTLSTIMLIILQHNAAHLGIVTGLCISEAINKHINKFLGRVITITAMLAAVSTAMAEVLGAAIALDMLFNIPLKLGALISAVVIIFMLFSNSYKKIEKVIIGFVSIIGISFIFETFLVNINWGEAIRSAVVPSIPVNSLPIIMSVLGAVVMPHNLFLHSEVIQSRKWNLKDKSILERQLKYEFMDTMLSMIIGFIINSAMILVAITFYNNNVQVTELEQAQTMLKPLLGNSASIIFAIALLFAGLASSVTAGMAGGSIFAGLFGEEYDINSKSSKIGVLITTLVALVIIFFISNPFEGLLYSQMLLSIQLPITIFTQIYLTSSKKVMGKYKNTTLEKIVLWSIAGIVTILNIMLLISSF
ncbi:MULTISPECIES: Nramp family divalent metal transporter [Clostridium]|mgnify:FL=1|jgi:Mn2+ and Fe2+ transporters of the NRAMP family|uniref:Mn transporter n=3 Tax=Clostridium TaxID=1485 RepID=A0AAV3W0T3_9CLOT|nr:MULTISPECIES: Nramp family divalent metal transporter [Clostridium]ABR33681.1 natural resistance-associated macrophage protein [Clostridium beijerinckii NCIMB 8052]AIU02878.1 natural resistance-associated macrophage protein [Clostridium beijerinckii ATCC 35702]MBF7812100.1 Nramp family divalent metal transporter [Clostridium beijerinckii]NRT25043.1 manganese transport protein [Clostridium beijerinckii]NRT67363.1 manganese transport protein [Clostridium beijerinckii]